MMIKNKNIPIRRLLSVFIGWLHVTLLISPFYSIIMNVILQQTTREEVIRNHLRALLLIVPVIISWFARQYLKNIILYLLASAAAIAVTIWMFGTPLMAIPAVFICFLRFYNRLVKEERSLMDHPGYAGIPILMVPFIASFFTEQLDNVYQSISCIYMAVYFLLCFLHHGIERINSYVDVNKDMRNMPARRIIRISSTLLALFFVVFAAILLPGIIGADLDYQYVPPEVEEGVHEYLPPETETDVSSPEEGMMMPGMENPPNPILTFIARVTEYVLIVGFCIAVVIGIIYAAMHLSRSFRKSFQDRGDFVENLQDDDLEVIREKQRKRDKPGLFDRSPNALVRRKYRKTVLRASKNKPAAWMTPTEAEENANLTGERISALHALYEKARYSADGCTKQDAAEL